MQLLAEASSLSQPGLHGAGLGLQSSMNSLWQESSGVGLGSTAGQMLPPLVGKPGGSGAQQSARQSSHLGQVGGIQTVMTASAALPGVAWCAYLY